MTRIRFLFWLDTLLLLTVPLLQSPRGTGIVTHEWLGIGFATVVALHLLVNWRWIVTTLRRLASGSRRSRVNATLNGTLFVTMTLTVFSGFAISEVVLPLVGRQPSNLRAWRGLHHVVAVLSVILVGFHLALNWDWIVGVARNVLSLQSTPDGSVPAALDVDGRGDEESGE
jgi:predicted ferric reductase